MCDIISGFINPKTFDIKIHDISSHHLTQEHFGLDDSNHPNKWREFHYLDDESIECRVLPIDSHSAEECESSIRAKFPTFKDFLRFCVVEKNCVCSEEFDLPDLTSAEGLKIPRGVKHVDLFSLTSVKGLKFPEGVEIVGLDSLTSAEGLVFPEGVEIVGLDSLTSAEGLKIPKGCYVGAPDCPDIDGQH